MVEEQLVLFSLEFFLGESVRVDAAVSEEKISWVVIYSWGTCNGGHTSEIKGLCSLLM